MIEPPPEPQAAEAVVPEGVRRARAAFLRDFPTLIADRKMRGRYVCYHNEACVIVAKNYAAILREVAARNIPDDASLIFKVVPSEDVMERAFAEESELP